MSNSIKEIYDYDLVKKLCRSKNILLIANFNRKLIPKDGLDPRCIPCLKKKFLDNRDRVKQNYLKNQDRLNVYQKKYNYESKEKINLYIKNRIKTDVNFRINRNTRRRIHHALNDKTKPSSTRDILGMDNDLYRKWIEFHITPEMNWTNIELDHVKPFCMFDVSDNEQLKEAFSWKNTQPLLKRDHHQKGTKFKLLYCQLQFIEAYQFIKINDQEGLNQDLHC